MKALSQFMSTRMCCLRENQVVQIMLTETYNFTLPDFIQLFTFIPHSCMMVDYNIIICTKLKIILVSYYCDLYQSL